MMKSHASRACLLSILFMGLGQIYNRQFIKGILFALIEIIFIFRLLPFIRYGLWGIYTLGETPQAFVDGKIVQGDHSIFLMVYGIISIVLILVFALLYYLNCQDAYKVGELRDNHIQPNKFIQSLKLVGEKGFPYLMLTPAAFFTLFITVVPLIFGVLVAFTNYSAPNHIPPRKLVDWVGFQTFKELFTLAGYKETFFGVFRWTVVWAILSTVTTYFSGLIFAVIINSNGIKLKKFWRTIFILPWAVPGYISILVFRNIFNAQFGPLNKWLVSLGFERIQWFGDPTWVKIVCLAVNLWLGFPYFLALMSGVLTGIPKDLYEAAEVEGANTIQKFFKITLPLVLFSTAPMLIMSFAYNFNNFNLIHFLNSGGPVNTSYKYAGHTDILLSWIYKLTLEQNQFNKACAVSIIIFIIIATISIFNFRRTRSFKEEDMIQ
ncbi:putative arabinogalactan oligomer transport system permease protein GanP [Thermoclostridium stercorarium subsp. stercorarium DSM 8532]|uniref:Maltose/maltodextrin transport system permease protein n=2 Tax=Thermoclostridium stercorarium TaxID=1510 RepID=L7VMU0_THES1|nr:ABC transporter permease subunit [Thermoclostridium stercorarium]AGC67974.1 putative arabinogalactan oligomer transport system permease protein GanP [Thermoclostridium stercorarium subsp. stercorarium DSM 8532]